MAMTAIRAAKENLPCDLELMSPWNKNRETATINTTATANWWLKTAAASKTPTKPIHVGLRVCAQRTANHPDQTRNVNAPRTLMNSAIMYRCSPETSASALASTLTQRLRVELAIRAKIPRESKACNKTLPILTAVTEFLVE